jgi:Leucine-rich repeat (LRR) protein
MKIYIRNNTEYDAGIHPEVTEILFSRIVIGKFFEKNRFPNLIKLECSGGNLLTLNRNCPSLREELTYDQMTSLRLESPSLQELWCNMNDLKKLELNCPSLQILHCDNNDLSKLELKLPSLRELNCCGNKLTELKLNCPQTAVATVRSPFLQRLKCCGNKLTTLELNCQSLLELQCDYNHLTSLKLNCPSLEVLVCNDNNLTYLNGLEFCHNLRELNCSQSLEESVDILKSHLPNLKVNYV